jgi:hypothetical protein
MPREGEGGCAMLGCGVGQGFLNVHHYNDYILLQGQIWGYVYL